MKSETIQAIIISVVVFLAFWIGVWLVEGKPETLPKVMVQGGCSEMYLTPAIQSHRSYCIQSDAKDKVYPANQPVQYTFAIQDDLKTVMRNFATTHTKLMHVIVVRKDLHHFQHLHPEFNAATGQFTLPDLRFPADGIYRIFADFAFADGQMNSTGMPLGITVSEDVVVGAGTKYLPEPIGALAMTKTFDGHQVSLLTDLPVTSEKEISLTFDLKQNNQPVIDLQEYLGALGHSVILREGTLDFIHAHPVESIRDTQNGQVHFMVYFPEPGTYKVFTQFQRAGKVVTTDFVLSVAQGAAMQDVMMPPMDHTGTGH